MMESALKQFTLAVAACLAAAFMTVAYLAMIPYVFIRGGFAAEGIWLGQWKTHTLDRWRAVSRPS